MVLPGATKGVQINRKNGRRVAGMLTSSTSILPWWERAARTGLDLCRLSECRESSTQAEMYGVRRTERGQTFRNPGSGRNGIVGVGSPPLSFVAGHGIGGDPTSARSGLTIPQTPNGLHKKFANNSVHGSAPECFFSGLGKYPHLISGISLSGLSITPAKIKENNARCG